MLWLRLLQKWDWDKLVSIGQVRAHSFQSDKIWQPGVPWRLNRLREHTTLEQDEHAGDDCSAYADLNDSNRAARRIHRPRRDYPPVEQQRIQVWEKAAFGPGKYFEYSILDFLWAKSKPEDSGEIELHVSGPHLRRWWHLGYPCECADLADLDL